MSDEELICPICEHQQHISEIYIKEDGLFYECSVCALSERKYYWELFKENKKFRDALKILSDPKNFENVCCACDMDSICRIDDDSYDSFIEIAKEALK